MRRGKDSMARSLRRFKHITQGTTFTARLAQHIADTEIARIAAQKKKSGPAAPQKMSLPAIIAAREVS